MTIFYEFLLGSDYHHERRDLDGINDLMKQLSGSDRKVDLASFRSMRTANRLCIARDGDLNTQRTANVVGMASLIPVETLSRKKGLIEDVVTLASSRGEGIGHELMRQIEAEARRLNLEALELTSSPNRQAANRLYKSLGYEQRETNVYRLKL